MLSAAMSRVRTAVSSLPVFLGALIPVFKSCPPCPMCVPKYAALLGLFGLELADYSVYLAPLMALSMLVTLGLMYRQMRLRHLTHHPLILAAVSCAGLLISKYVVGAGMGIYGVFMVGLFGAIIWHQRNVRQAKSCCPGH